MAKTNKNTNKNNKPVEKSYVSPTKRLSGKIIISTLVIAMVIGSLALVIYMIVNSLLSV